MNNNKETIEWYEWWGDEYMKYSRSKCGRYTRGWEWLNTKNISGGVKVFFTIDHVKCTKVGGIESIINKI